MLFDSFVLLVLFQRVYKQIFNYNTRLTDRVKEVSHPFGDYESQNDGNAKRDVTSTFDNDHC